MSVSTLCLVLSGLLWGTGGLIGTLFGRAAGLSALSVAAYRLLAGGGPHGRLPGAGRPPGPAGRAAWARIAVNGLLSALFQGCYFAAISLTSVSLATLITIGGTPVIVTIAEQVTGRRALGRAGALPWPWHLPGSACSSAAGRRAQRVRGAGGRWHVAAVRGRVRRGHAVRQVAGERGSTSWR